MAAKPDPKDEQNKANNNQSTGRACRCGGSGVEVINGKTYDCSGPGPH